MSKQGRRAVLYILVTVLVIFAIIRLVRVLSERVL